MSDKWIEILKNLENETDIEKVRGLIKEVEDEAEKLDLDIKILKSVRNTLIDKYYDLM